MPNAIYAVNTLSRTDSAATHVAENLEPVAAIDDPSACKKNRDGGAQCPPHRQNEISDLDQNDEHQPKHLSLPSAKSQLLGLISALVTETS